MMCVLAILYCGHKLKDNLLVNSNEKDTGEEVKLAQLDSMFIPVTSTWPSWETFIAMAEVEQSNFPLSKILPE